MARSTQTGQGESAMSDSKPSRTIALTGATGFVGGHILRLLQARGHKVRALTRRPPPSVDGTTHPAPVRWIRGDLSNLSALEDLTNGADAVIHCAGLVKASRSAHFFDANQQAVANLLQSVHHHDGNKPAFLLMSSLAAREPHLSPYAASKAAGEQVLKEGGDDLDWLIVRPPAVYGPGDFEILKLFKSLRFGIGLVPGGRENKVSVIYVEDLARLACDWAETPMFEGKTLEADDGAPGGYRIGDIYTEAARLLNRNVRLVRAPSPLLTMAAQINTAMARLSGRPAMLTPGKVRELTHHDWVCRPDDRITSLWSPEYRLAEGLKATLAWYRNNRLL